MKKKAVKITYHTLMKKAWVESKEGAKKQASDQNDETPYYEIENVLDYILSIKRLRNKFYDLKDNKFCYIDSVTKEVPPDGDIIIYTGVFESARDEFRPNLVDKKTGEKRSNPKAISEGDIERTHFCVKIDKNQTKEVYVFLERNFYGVNIHNLTNYISKFAEKLLKKNNKKKFYTIINYQISNADFLNELQNLQRTVVAEVHFSKQLLGGQCLGFSNRLISLQNDLILTAKASRGDSIKETVVDIWNYSRGKNSPISRIRVKGVDPNNHDILLDTSLMCKADMVEIERNDDTGEINSFQLFNAMKNIANSY